ncbi:hypothetical protein OGZ01_16785 [Vibrio harveyi]|nr:hypothetical protein [Vibrio harveyi]
MPQIVVILLLVVLIQGLGYWFYLKPEQEQLNNLIQEEQTLKVALRIKANKVAALPQLQSGNLMSLLLDTNCYCNNCLHRKSWQPCWLR